MYENLKYTVKNIKQKNKKEFTLLNSYYQQ